MSLFRSLKKRWMLHALRRKWGGNWQLHPAVKPRVPLRVVARGGIYVGSGVSFGDGGAPMVGDGAITLQARKPAAQIRIGDNCAFSNNVTVVATERITIGERCMVGDLAAIYDSDFHGVNPRERHTQGKSAAVRIGDSVWIGSRVMVLKGVTIGDNSVVAAGAIVVSDVPANTLVGGVPARVIRMFDPPSA